uniref:Uncharacterized protein n=1 Tax=Moniliophthora roreri TaxID=221103 RepID=A0A0W0F7D1_MONRR
MVARGRGQHARMHTGGKPPQKNSYPLAEAGDKEDHRGHTLKICSLKTPTAHDKDDRSDGGEVRSEYEKIGSSYSQSVNEAVDNDLLSSLRRLEGKHFMFMEANPITSFESLASFSNDQASKDPDSSNDGALLLVSSVEDSSAELIPRACPNTLESAGLIDTFTHLFDEEFAEAVVSQLSQEAKAQGAVADTPYHQNVHQPAQTQKDTFSHLTCYSKEYQCRLRKKIFGITGRVVINQLFK